MIVYNSPNAFEEIQRVTETKFHEFISKNSEEIKNIVIVGAHHGLEISRLRQNYPQAEIFAIEAVEEHYKVLVRNYKNDCKVHLYNKVISETNGKVVFYELGNGGEGSGSILEFQGDKFGHPFKIKSKLELASCRLDSLLPDLQIDLLWVDVQGAELQVLKSTNLDNCSSLFLEIHTRDYVKEWDKEPYKGQAYREDLENYLVDFSLHSIGLDNASGNGQGNSFWVRKS